MQYIVLVFQWYFSEICQSELEHTKAGWKAVIFRQIEWSIKLLKENYLSGEGPEIILIFVGVRFFYPKIFYFGKFGFWNFGLWKFSEFWFGIFYFGISRFWKFNLGNIRFWFFFWNFWSPPSEIPKRIWYIFSKNILMFRFFLLVIDRPRWGLFKKMRYLPTLIFGVSFSLGDLFPPFFSLFFLEAFFSPSVVEYGLDLGGAICFLFLTHW